MMKNSGDRRFAGRLFLYKTQWMKSVDYLMDEW
jgi:hypothetical protein